MCDGCCCVSVRACVCACRLQMPASAPHGFSYYTPPATTPATVQSAAQLSTVFLKPNSQINRIQMDAGWVPVSQCKDFAPLIR